MDENYLEVRFDKYCGECKHCDLKEFKDPCNECLSYPYNFKSPKPIHFEEQEK